GKLAQRVGWDEKNRRPPRSHCLPLAGWITSHCRAALYRVMVQIPPDKLIAVETDGLYTTIPPEKLRMTVGDGLGEWGYKAFEEMLYLQSGVYHRKSNGEWLSPKARGLDSASVSGEIIEEYFQECKPGDFPVLAV